MTSTEEYSVFCILEPTDYVTMQASRFQFPQLATQINNLKRYNLTVSSCLLSAFRWWRWFRGGVDGGAINTLVAVVVVGGAILHVVALPPQPMPGQGSPPAHL